MSRKKRSRSVLFAGDTSFGENYQDKLEQFGDKNILKSKGYDYSLQKLKPFLRKADAVIANLETPISHVKESPFSGKKQYIHYADAHHTPVTLARYGITAVSLANNHSIDLGIDGMMQTISIASMNGIATFGCGNNLREAMKPIYLRFSTEAGDFSLYVIGAFERRKGLYDTVYQAYAEDRKPGVNPLDPVALAEQVKFIRAHDPNAYIVLFPHWGKVYSWKTKRQVKLAHACINAGVDLIIGHGAHMIQEIERYRGKWIVYSIGNFMFNSPGRYARMKADPFSIACRLIISPRKGKPTPSLQLYPLLTDNKSTRYRTRPLNEAEFSKFCSLMDERIPSSAQWRSRIKAKRNKLGYYLWINVGRGLLKKGANKSGEDEVTIEVEANPEEKRVP